MTRKIKHDGSACPVSPGTEVRIWLRDETENIGRADEFAWDHQSDVYDILSYAVITPDWAVEGPKLAETLKRLLSKYRSCARAHGNSDEVIESSIEFARTALSRIKGEEG